jgi:hypothetical protein
LEGELIFRYSDRTTETISAGKTVFVPAGVAHIYTAGPGARYLIVLTPRLRALIAALEADREPASRKYTDASIPSFGSSESSRQERSHLFGSNILNRLRFRNRVMNQLLYHRVSSSFRRQLRSSASL